MNELSIKKVYYKKLQGNPIRSPRARFTQYYDDLCKELSEEPIKPECFMQGTQYTYVELLDSLLPEIKEAGDLDNLELIIISFWSPEFDPDHACGAYLCHRYRFNGKIVDISDCGFLSPFIALSAIQAYMQQENITRALLISLDQTTAPQATAKNLQSLPEYASIGALLIEKHSSTHQSGLALILSTQIANHQLSHFLINQIEEKQIKRSDVLLTCNQNILSQSVLWPFKNIIYDTHFGNSVEKLFSLKILRHANDYARYSWHILLVQDPRSNQWGVLMVRNFL